MFLELFIENIESRKKGFKEKFPVLAKKKEERDKDKKKKNIKKDING